MMEMRKRVNDLRLGDVVRMSHAINGYMAMTVVEKDRGHVTCLRPFLVVPDNTLDPERPDANGAFRPYFASEELWFSRDSTMEFDIISRA